MSKCALATNVKETPPLDLDAFAWASAPPGILAAMYGLLVARHMLVSDLPTRRARKEFRRRHLQLVGNRAQQYRETGDLQSAEDEAKFLESYRHAIALQLALPASTIDVRGTGG